MVDNISIPVYPFINIEPFGLCGLVGSSLFIVSYDGKVKTIIDDVLDDSKHALGKNIPTGISRSNPSNNNGNDLNERTIPDIISVTYNSKAKRIALVTLTKIVQVWQLKEIDSNKLELSLIWSRIAIKKGNCLSFSKDGSRLLLADKFGDVFGFCIDDDIKMNKNWIVVEENKIDKDDKEEPVKEPKNVQKALAATSRLTSKASYYPIILGHISMLFNVLISPCGKYVLTSERDEKIRVSLYPNSYEIGGFLLGHQQYVATLCFIEDKKKNLLLSGGGDEYIILWDWKKYELISKFNIKDMIKEKYESNNDNNNDFAIREILFINQEDAGTYKIALTIEGYSDVIIGSINSITKEFKIISETDVNGDPISISVINKKDVIVSVLKTTEDHKTGEIAIISNENTNLIESLKDIHQKLSSININLLIENKDESTQDLKSKLQFNEHKLSKSGRKSVMAAPAPVPKKKRARKNN